MAETKPPAAPSKEAIKARIISHMNKDHTYELSHYLRAFNDLSAPAARNPQLLDVTLDCMTIKSASGTHTVPIVPPMKGLMDSRVRMIEMAQAAQRKLGLSDIRISTYAPPAGGGIISFIGVSFYFFCLATLSLVQPATWAWDAADAWFPGGVAWYRWLVKALIIPVLVVHLVEAWWMARTRLYKHGINGGSMLWLLWVATTFFEGAPTMFRFDAMVEEQRKQREAAKH